MHDLPSDLGGVTRTRVLLERGVTRHRLARAVAEGSLRRIKHGWVASPDADPTRVFAARHGLTISCVLQARRLGLWVRDREAQHFAVPRPGAELRPAATRLHYHRPLIPREPYCLADRVENVLWIVGHCQPHPEAVATWDAALNLGMVDREYLERLPLNGVARRVLADTSPFADSGLESHVRQRLRWLRLKLHWQAWVLGHRVDFLIGERLVLQIDGRDHVGRQRASDTSHDARLTLRGYTVIRVGYEEVMYRWPDVQSLIMAAVAQGLHRADPQHTT